MAKAKKSREKTYVPKLAIKGTFEDVIGLSVGKQPVKNNEVKKKPKKA